MHPHIFCHFLRKEYKEYSFIRMYIMFASNVTFLLNLKIRIYLQVISPSDTQHTKKSRSILSGAPLLRMTLVFECKFSTVSTLISLNCLFCLLQIVHFVLDAYRLNKAPMKFQWSLRLPLVERPIHWYRRAFTKQVPNL